MRAKTRWRGAADAPSMRRARGLGLLGAAAAIALIVAACGTALPSATRTPPPQTPADIATLAPTAIPPSATPAATAGTARVLRISTLDLQLPVATSRASAFADGEAVLLAGGLTPSGTIATVVRIDLSAGTATTDGHLAKAVHDTGGALVAGAPTVFGGGNVVPEAIVQAYEAGTGTVIGELPRARADLVAIDLGGMAAVVGGGTPARLDRAVLTTTDGTHFTTLANLLEGVRYPAVATLDGLIVVAGGTDGVRDRTEIQAIDIATGTVRIIGKLPRGISHATALVVSGRLLIAGGRSGGVAQDGVWEIDPATGDVRLAGHLPKAVSDMAGVVVGDVGYLLGGERADYVRSIISLAFA